MRPMISALCSLVIATSLFASDPAPETHAPMIESVAPAVVTVYTERKIQRAQMPGPMMDEDQMRRFFGGPGRRGGPGGAMPRQVGQGSGVIVVKDGLILTNNHVIEGADNIEVQLRGERERLPAKLVGTDPKTDVAVLRIEVKGRTLPTIAIADSDKVRVGDLVFAIGNPFGVGHSVSMGIVSATGRGDVGITDYEDFIQTDASINPGNSGGALVDSLGRLVGINTAIYSRSGGNVGIGFAIPANIAKRMMDQLVAGGKVVRGYLGVQISPLDAGLARKFGLDGEHGALVNEVVEGGPAGKAGIQAGDVIVRLGATQIADPRQLRMLVAGIAPGSDAELTILREGKEQSIAIKVGELSGEMATVATGDGPGDQSRVGIALRDIDQAARREYEIPPRIQGALIVEVAAGSRAERAGLQTGMVITEVERRPVADANATVQQLRLAKGELLLRVWAEGGLRWIVVPE